MNHVSVVALSVLACFAKYQEIMLEIEKLKTIYHLYSIIGLKNNIDNL